MIAVTLRGFYDEVNSFMRLAMYSRAFLKCTLLLMVLLMTACSFTRRLPFSGGRYSPLPTDLPSQVAREDMLLILGDRAPAVETLWARFGMQVKTTNPRRSDYCTATFLYQPPGKARIRGYKSALPNPVFEILSSGNDIHFHANMEKTIYSGTLDEWRRSPVTYADIDLRDVGSLLMPLQILRQVLEGPGGELDSSQRAKYFLMLRAASLGATMKGNIRLEIRKSDLLVSRLDLLDNTGKPRVTVEYLKYEISEDGTILPERVLIRFSDPEASVMLKGISYKINRTFGEAVFQPPSYRGLRQMPLRALWEEPLP